METVVLVDGMNLAFRAHHSYKGLTSRMNQPTGVVYGFMRMLLDITRRVGECTIIVCWEGEMVDDRGTVQLSKPTWRKGVELGKQYKSNREPSMDRELVHRQMFQVMEVLNILKFPQVSIPSLEGDDVIGVLSACFAKQSQCRRVYIYSSDRDFFQCITDKVHVLRPEFKGKYKVYKAKDVIKEHGIKPQQWVRFRALTGDSSDRIPGIKGVGPVKACQLLAEGLNPSKPWEEHPKGLRKAFAQYASHWQTANACWVLAKIPKVPAYSRFPKAARKALVKVASNLQGLCTRQFTAAERKAAMKQFVSFCGELNISTFIADRNRFFPSFIKE